LVVFRISAFQAPNSETVWRKARVEMAVERTDIRVDVSLVLVPVHVTTQDGMTVTDLSRDNFQIFDNNLEQTVKYFARDDAPVSVGLLLDTSDSMRPKLRRAVQAAASFFRTAKN